MRNIYLSNTPVEEALRLFKEAVAEFRVPTEMIPVVDALGRTTGEAVYAKCNSPLYNSAAMDGIAVVAAKTHGAGESTPLILRVGDFVHVDTGDWIRSPYDAVIMAEDIQAEGESATIRAAAAPWQHVRPVGEDIVLGEMILPGKHILRPMDIGVLLSGGITEVAVLARPTVAIIPTGTEMIEPGDVAKEGDIIESNSYMLQALVQQSGGLPTRFAPVPDEYDKIVDALKNAAEQFDMVLVIAGTSAGREDYTVRAVEALGRVVVHGVAMKPGKPVILAVVGGKPVIGVPGYPVSAYIAYENFAAPVLEAQSFYAKTAARATLSRKLVSSVKYREYVRVRVGKVGDRLVASPLARGAGAAMSLVRADGFCVIEQDKEGIEAGETVDVLLCRRLDDLERTVVSIGSHDLILDVLADMMDASARLASTHVGSMGGLLALKNGEAHIAPIHLLDEETGVYNTPFIKKLFPSGGVALIKGVGRVQCIMVRKGNPLNISGLEDLPRCNYVNRQRGAGTRLLLDYKLKMLGISPQSIPGYEKEAATHMAVAAAIKDGGADAGLGILSAAKAMGLDYIPIGEEEYDFAIPAEFLNLPHIVNFIETLQSSAFLSKLESLGGYTASQCGQIMII